MWINSFEHIFHNLQWISSELLCNYQVCQLIMYLVPWCELSVLPELPHDKLPLIYEYVWSCSNISNGLIHSEHHDISWVIFQAIHCSQQDLFGGTCTTHWVTSCSYWKPLVVLRTGICDALRGVLLRHKLNVTPCCRERVPPPNIAVIHAPKPSPLESVHGGRFVL